jgi:mannose-6-phosphate isomerase-like protein (cupin superfamily)
MLPMFESRNLADPDEEMEFPNGAAAVVTVGGKKILRVTFDPGFRWTNDMSPTAGTEKCQLRHVFHVLSGRMGLRLPDGTEREVKAGDVVAVAPGHDSWTIGDGPVVFVDFDPFAG